MASHEEWCEEQLSKLSNEDTRVPILQEMKDFLTAIPREEMSRTANSLQLPAVFDCLNDSNSEQVDLACEILSLCMTNLNLGESTNKYGVFLERALNHPFPAVKMMALNEIKRNIENEDILVDLCKRESLLINIISCVGDNDLGVAKNASEIITTVGLSSVGIKQLTRADILKALHEIMEVNEIVRFRVYELLIQISMQSETNFNELKTTGLLSQILDELDNNDILLRLNVVELLSQLGLTKHGYEYLEGNDTLKKLPTMLDGDDVVTIQLCEPGILKFFGNMAHWKPIEILSKHPNLFQRMFKNLESDDFTIVGVSLDTLGHIGLPNEGKVALDSTGAPIDTAIKTITKSLPSMPTEIKVRGLNCLENLLHIVDYNNQITMITRKWYSLIDDNPIDFIWNYAKNPFFELRVAGFGILHAMSEQTWGQEVIKNTPGLLEFLLDRNVENIKECKESKYSIVESLSRSQVFDHLTLKRLEAFVREGPFYVQAITEVALERND
ncbi:26S proteasome non-ATPase regulatory subunit 5 [Asbolus verrucosus]|uniref:26S proteasome non-ATPase regulatory subunit 5 n=1 Tax=Asbolus verrucosus TaxID=1661398 RepID=A0A482V6V7_ASBVE|nr:26S proteasome non-ATPase regulatory subunit 5 [Asbolus verrucosus]